MFAQIAQLLLSSAACFGAYVMFFWRNQEVTEGLLVKRPAGLPWIGHIQYLAPETLISSMKQLKKYGPAVELFIFKARYLFLYDIGSMKEVLSKRPKHFRREHVLGDAFDELGLNPHSVFIAEGKRWRELRRLLLSPFSKTNVDNMVPLISEEVDILLKRLEQFKEAEVDACKVMMRYTLGVIVRTSLGKVDIDEDATGNQILLDTSTLFEYFQQRVLFPGPRWAWRWFRSNLSNQAHEANQRLDKMVFKILQTEQNRRKKKSEDVDDQVSNDGCKPFITLLLDVDEEGKLSDEEVVANIKTFMLAGSETTSVSLTWCLYYLVLNKAFFDTLREEADRNHVNNASTDPTAFPFGAAVFREATRLSGPSAFTGACSVSITEPYKLATGVVINPYDTILLMTEALLKDPQTFQNPEEFNPLRWIQSDSEDSEIFATKLKRMNESYFSFGGGTRVCPGIHLANIESILVLGEIVRNFDLELSCKPEEIHRIVQFTFKAETMPMKFVKRKS